VKSSAENIKFVWSPIICRVEEQSVVRRCCLFFAKNQCEVHHVLVQDKIEYEYAGKILNLGKLKKVDSIYPIELNDFISYFSFSEKINLIS